jgi:uncharacterized protein with ParB-like and HNH nuclease domain/predicted transport protein
MKASEIGFLEFLRQADQLTVPIYQRTYSWTDKQLEQLWKDVSQAANSGAGHFVGSIVYILGEGEIGRVNQAQVIDGQQRLTTITLLLVALARRLEEPKDSTEMTAQRIRSRYLYNRDEEGEDRFKLLLGKQDKETLIRVVEGFDEPQAASDRVLAALSFFTTALERTSLVPDQVFAGLERLHMVGIALDRRYDNPQLIFDSLNSTGLDLSEADRIRNYVLMDLPLKDQGRIYDASWYPMEQLFGADGSGAFDRFVRDYLTLKTGQIPRIDQVYEAFKAYAAVSSVDRDDLVKDVYRMAKLWVRLAFEREGDKALRAAIEDINRLRVDVAYPFLLDVLDDEENGKITHAEVLAVFRTVESYVFRRAICAIPTNVLNKTFAGLSREIDETAYMESFNAALLLKESYARMPTDEEFRSQLVVRDVYNFRNRNYLLDKLENHGRKEPIRVDDYTIEHVMPQNPDLSPEWQNQLGPHWQLVQERLLHTLGNLTLTGYNSELSDHPFSTKLAIEGGFKDSPLRLNRYVATLTVWNESQIERRAEQLADTAIQVWPIPSLPEQVLAKYRRSKTTVGTTYTLDDHPELAGSIGLVFHELRRRVMNLDAGVREDVRKQYIAYKYAGNFLSVVPLRSELKMYLVANADTLHNPRGLAKDVSTVGHWGTGNTGVRISALSQMDDVIDLVQQALNRQIEEGYDEPSWPEAAVESLIERIGNPDVEHAVRGVVDAAVRSGLYPRPWTKSLMFAPPSNRNRTLFTFSVEDDGRIDLYCEAEAFRSFFNLDPKLVAQQIGPAGPTTLGLEELRALPDRIESLMADAEIPTNGAPRPRWNGHDFYVVLGGGRSWEDCRRLGFVSAGGGEFYSRPLQALFPGARVFAYVPGSGYVAVGTVREKVRPVTEFAVSVGGDKKMPLLEVPGLHPHFREFYDDPEKREYMVAVEWLTTRPVEEAVWEPGLFSNQNTVCRLRDQETIDFVSEKLGVPDSL